MKILTILRSWQGLGANINSQVASIVMQLLSVPIFLRTWDLQEYGRWIMISAIPAYLSLADFGITTASGNVVLKQISQGRTTSAIRQLHSAAKYSSIVYATVLSIFAGASIAATAIGIVSINDLVAILLLSTTVMLSLTSAAIDIGYRANNRIALGTNLLTCGRIAEWIGSLVGLTLGGTIISVAIGITTARSIFLLGHLAHSSYTNNHPRYSYKHAKYIHIQAILSESAAFFLMPLIYSMQIQGTTLILGFFINPSYAGAFTAIRTYSRIGSQAAAVICRTIWPKLTKLHAEEKHTEFQKEILLAFKIIATGSVAIVIIQYLSRDLVNKFWASGKLDLEGSLLVYLLISCVIGNLAQVPSTALLSTNQHKKYTLTLTLASGIYLALMTISAKKYGEFLVGPVVLTGELLILIATTWSFKRLPLRQA